MNALAEKKATDDLVRMLADRLPDTGEPVADVALAAAACGIFPSSVEAHGAIAVLEALGLVRVSFGIVAPGKYFSEVKSRRAQTRLLFS